MGGPEVSPGESPAVAVACDDGVLRLFGADGGSPGVHYRRSFAHVEGRVLAVAWHPSGRTLVSGHSDGCLRAWDAASSREVYRITACAPPPPLPPPSPGTDALAQLSLLPGLLHSSVLCSIIRT